jgi:hypothetical protein
MGQAINRAAASEVIAGVGEGIREVRAKAG